MIDNICMKDKYANKLSSISDISVGYPFRGAMSEVRETGVHVVQMKNISEKETIDWSSCIETQLTGKRKPDYLKTNDILFVSRGSHNYAVTIEMIPDNKDVVASPHIFIIRTNTNRLLPKYLAWLLNQRPCQRHFMREAEGSITKNIRRNVLENTPIAIPTLEKQQTIIKLAKQLKQEQHILKQLIHNGDTMMNAIANDLFATTPQQPTKQG